MTGEVKSVFSLSQIQLFLTDFWDGIWLFVIRKNLLAGALKINYHRMAAMGKAPLVKVEKMGEIKVKYSVKIAESESLACMILLLCMSFGLVAFPAFDCLASQKSPTQQPPNQQSATKSKPPQNAADSVWVAKSDGAQSCEPKTGMSLKQGAEDLSSLKIPILDSKKASDGKMHAQMCGASKGTENSYLIPRKNLVEANQAGFREVPPLN
jgi:hypothetical protein